MVHLKTYVTPAVPLKVVVGLAADTKLPPVPEMIDHAPVPTVAVFAARVALVAQRVWSGPALDVVGN
jgi:hypothetical protein